MYHHSGRSSRRQAISPCFRRFASHYGARLKCRQAGTLPSFTVTEVRKRSKWDLSTGAGTSGSASQYAERTGASVISHARGRSPEGHEPWGQRQGKLGKIGVIRYDLHTTYSLVQIKCTFGVSPFNMSGDQVLDHGDSLELGLNG